MGNGIGAAVMRRPSIPVLLLLVIGLALLLTKHWVHALGFLPYAFLLACPLMHLFHGHGGQHRRHGEDAQRHAAR